MRLLELEYSKDVVYECWVQGRGQIYVVRSEYFHDERVKVDSEVLMDGERYLIRGIEATEPLGKTIGLVVRKVD